MQRRSALLLLKGAFDVGQKRPMAAATAPANTAAATASLRFQSTPPPPRSAMAAPGHAGAAAAPVMSAASATSGVAPMAAASRPAGSLVTPPSSAAQPAKKKKIIRRIVKRRKVSHAGASSGVGAEAAEPSVVEEEEDRTATTTTTTAAAAAATTATAAMSEPTAAAATTTGAAAAAPPRRGLAMLHEIRKRPEGALTEEEPTQSPSSDYGAEATAEPAAAAAVPPAAAEAAAAAVEEGEEGGDAPHYTPSKRGSHDTGRRGAAAAKEKEKVPTSFYDAEAADAAADAAAGVDEDDFSTVDVFSSSSSSAARKTAMVKAFRVDEVAAQCASSDAMFARRLPSGGCQFFAWPGTPLPVASAAIVSMPDTIRTVHAVFGRVGTPIDIVMDIDCPVPQEYWSMSKIRPFQRKVIDDVLGPLKEEIEKIGERIETQVVLQSPNLKKASFHVHTRLKDAAFADFYSLQGFLVRFQERLPNVDLQIYRPHGMLRMFSCMKENHTSAIVVYDDTKWNLGFPGGKVSDEQAALHSICVRDPSTFSRVLTFDTPRGFQIPAYGGGKAVGADGKDVALPPQVLLPRTEKEAVENASRWLRQATELEVSEWRTWIGLGLCANRIASHFRNAKNLRRPAMEEMLDAWTEASRKCPLKFRSGECETRWAAFQPDRHGERSDWWGAYKRLGKLEVPMREAVEREAEAAARHHERNARFAAAAAAAALPGSSRSDGASAGASESVVSASRVLRHGKKSSTRRA
ncbi:mitochondrial DNA primase [Novymonas esmeraldas]|uniref:Mitochondrial DNA primase n=1 Tax=Novymonas esmeraldas TaxID=1808958 RepID=A0AAW0EMZ7_9TRYP